jgi:hypothetical protein
MELSTFSLVFWVLGFGSHIFFIFGCTVVAGCWLLADWRTGGLAVAVGCWLIVDHGARIRMPG